MGRGNESANRAAKAVRRATTNPIEEQLGNGTPLDQIFIGMSAADMDQPDWRTPSDFHAKEADQFIDPDIEGGLDIDHAIALRVLKPDFVGHDFQTFSSWYEPTRELIIPPEETCAGMNDAAKMLSSAVDDGEKIAVYCDYDVDGTTAGEILRRGLEPYSADLHYGYADAQQGFGLTNAFVEEAHKAGATILITLDCGSTQVDQVALAQSLGMKVIVVDHHNIADNPADFHLNPKLAGLPADKDGNYGPASSDNTGAQLSWKLVSALQAQREDDGRSRPEHWEAGVHLAGMGALADMASVMTHENRAFFWTANEHAVPGVRALAEALGEDSSTPGRMVLTQAALNLPKRTSNVNAEDIGKLFAAKTEAEAAPYVKKLLTSYEAAKPKRKEMLAECLAQTGEATVLDDGEKVRPHQENYFAAAVLDDFQDYAGYTGPVANTVSQKSAKPAVIFARREDGNYKFSSRNNAGAKVALGDLITDERMREACTMPKENESGEIVETAVVGGHAQLVSGACTKENVNRVIAVMEAWAAEQEQTNKKFYPDKWTGPEAFLTERKVPGDRFERIEEEARRLGPFSGEKQHLYQERDGARFAQLMSSNQIVNLSVEAKLSELTEDPENEDWLVGKLTFSDTGLEKEVRFPRDDENPPVGKKCEWLLRVGQGAPYYLRKYHAPKKKRRAASK